MLLIQDWFPPSRENWELILKVWQWFPIVTTLQWVLEWYPAGKTSNSSPLNLPGKFAWAAMESPGFITLLYIMYTLPEQEGLSSLPWQNWTMVALFTIHYIYRALLSPLLLNPTMSPIHVSIASLAVLFQLSNALSLGGWLGGHGPVTPHDWAGHLPYFFLGFLIWTLGLALNIFHDEDLREIRRAAMRKQQRVAKEQGKPVESVQKIYMVPKNGLFRWILFPHYLCEWVEWTGFWMMGGWHCMPARFFVQNEVATMFPRALQGWRWYVERFGREKIGSRKAIIPGML
ncbi:3-oxo-5-alpha-steroid 4-dehydrogenase-like protein [Patellaria atrata CBS 101060]|uniref:3-oxo-5-alpha-steroid 4-dehydrogenase-like protein n=1 Tax=Patellaria atrata CBS 101060 TaxID=1346257 RepID=A0A9P4SDR6_9PEZI|nr:3-oxo-5-alpha-steroid 4-dehydrogenase-like protein [Patellaria atrata CBS 101060]